MTLDRQRTRRRIPILCQRICRQFLLCGLVFSLIALSQVEEVDALTPVQLSFISSFSPSVIDLRIHQQQSTRPRLCTDYDYDYDYGCTFAYFNGNNSCRSRSRSKMTMMAKGDGKKKRKKQGDSAGSAGHTGSSTAGVASSSAQPQALAPMRVSNDINIPIRRQIQYGKLNKQIRQSGSNSFRQTSKKTVRTKYRRTWDEEEIEEKAEERRRKGQDPDWAVILNRTTTSPLVIVDGYNIIYKWPRLKKHMLKGDTGRARQMLIDDLENLRSIKDWRIEVVFDGAGKNLKSGPMGDTRRKRATAADKATSKEVSKHGVRTVFTGSGIEADTYIERRCAEAKNATNGATTGMFIVATDDGMIRLAGQNAGALCMGADRFVSELKAVKKAVAHRVEAAMAKVNGQAMRPEKLWGTQVFASSVKSSSVISESGATDHGLDTSEGMNVSQPRGIHKMADGRTIYTGRFGRGALIIEDKRKKN